MDSKRRKKVKGVTIDRKRTLFTEDGFYLEKSEDGEWVLHISISDISALLKFDDDSYKIAKERVFATSERPMLPTNFLCEVSLLEGKERPTITVSIPISSEAVIGNPVIRFTSFTSQKQLSYEEVAAIMGNKSHYLNPMLCECGKLAQLLKKKRKENGALIIEDFFIEEPAGNGQFNEMLYLSKIIVQEFMILANAVVAEDMTKKGVRFLYRNHTLKVTNSENIQFLEELKKQICNAAEAESFNASALRNRLICIFSKPDYSTRSYGHYFLGYKFYIHWTSPERRFPDLINHFIIVAYLLKQKSPYSYSDLKDLAMFINEAENIKWKEKGKLFRERERSNRKSFKEKEKEKENAIPMVINISEINMYPADVISRIFLTAVKRESRKIVAFKLLKKVFSMMGFSSAECDESGNADVMDVFGKNGFHKKVVSVCNMNNLPEEIEKVFLKRLLGEKLQIKDIFLILFSPNALDGKWIDLRHKILYWLLVYHKKVKNIINMANTQLNWPKIEYKTITKGSDNMKIYISQAKIILKGEEFESSPQIFFNIRKSQEIAAVALFGKILGIELDISKYIDIKILEDSEISFLKLDKGDEVNPLDNKSKLLNFCERNKREDIKYVVTKKGNGDNFIFTCSVSITIDDIQYEEKVFGCPSKEEAEQLSAAYLLEKLIFLKRD